MSDIILYMIKLLLCLLPFILFALLNMRANLKKRYRSRQFLMPALALVYCVLLLRFLPGLIQLLGVIIQLLPELLKELAQWLSQVLDGKLAGLGSAVSSLADALKRALEGANMTLVVFFAANAVFMLVHIIIKRILVSVLKAVFKNEGPFFQRCVSPFYEKDTVADAWCVKENCGQGRTFMKTMYIAALVISALAVMLTGWMYSEEMLSGMYDPVFGVIVIGEIFFLLDGMTKQEVRDELHGEDDSAVTAGDYSMMRPVLRRLFGDKLNSENTAVSASYASSRTNDELLSKLENSDDVRAEGYGRFMRRKLRAGLKLDQNYLASGMELLYGRSILFNNPFYYDLVPYVFYPMNRALLRHQKVLIVLGRHGVEEDLENWCRDGLTAVTNVPTMWNIGVLGDSRTELDVGLLTRSSVHDLGLHEANADFLAQVGFVVVIEPSRLVTTAQIGLNSIVRLCRRNNGDPVFCSFDKNCDGLVDSLSHILMTNITEVSATNHHEGVSSYMCWEADGERLQHRMLPNLSRYLGVGTELSIAALKNQIPETDWYGGEAFPVTDIHWIAKQYYYDLLHYADLPESQDTLDELFRVSANLWNARTLKRHYMTVEDESFNMFEIKRDFATRASEQGFINVISQDYLLRDYMAENDSIFNADPKAIPYIAADYAHTHRNVILRLCLRMSAGLVSEADVRQELMLIDADTKDLRESLRREICMWTGLPEDAELIRMKRKFSIERERMEDMYYITDTAFSERLLSDLQSAGYIAEDEKGSRLYLGSELRGHVFQKYLPGQFFTFSGKYYEMRRVTSDGHVLVRRAADHITGRPSYRQVRNYRIANAVDSATMGDRTDTGRFSVTVQYADIEVETPAYWRMERYNDFTTGKRIEVNGVPMRSYHNKQLLRIEFGGSTAPEVVRTLTLLLNETFRTLFAENHAYIAAVTPEKAEVPLTYSLECSPEPSPERNMIYIIEDSQLDLGLLDSVRRNLDRIFAMICDYLDWHLTTLEESLHPRPEQSPPDFTVDAGEEDKAKTWFGRAVKRIKRGTKRLGVRIGNVFRKIAGKPLKPLDGESKQAEGEPITAETEILDENSPLPEVHSGAADTGAASVMPEYAPDSGAADTAEAKPEEREAAPGEEEAAAEPENDETVPAVYPAEDETENAADAPETENENGTEPAADDADDTAAEDEDALSDESVDGPQLLLSAGADPRLYAQYDELAAAAAEPEPETVSYEPVRLARPTPLSGRRPYHERYYLLFGGYSVPGHLDIEGTHELLVGLGYAGSELEQARKGQSAAELIEKTFIPGKSGSHYCDFCGAELVGTEYEVLADGRERCISCGKTAVRSEAEFAELYAEVKKNMESFYGVRITQPVRIEMVNAQKLHKRLGKTFVPTGNSDGRVLGVAIKDKKGYSILIENGSPRMQSVMTMAHELTHIWQYLNWNRKAIRARYGRAQELEVYEGMAKWSEIQYAYLVNEPASAKREEIVTRMRDDEYGRGFRKYVVKYPLTENTWLEKQTPFMDREKPL